MVFNRGWIIDQADAPLARGRLTDIVAFLTRQRWRQLLLENSCAGLFWSLTVATAAVAVAKLIAPDVPIAIVITPIAPLWLLGSVMDHNRSEAASGLSMALGLPLAPSPCTLSGS